MGRRLAAIIAADMVGFSRQMQVDETGTLSRLKRLQTELVDPQVAGHRGRIFKTTGDGFLAEFASAIDALNCAVEIQSEIARRNLSLDPGERSLFRMGLNIGDIIIDDGDVYGDGVNIAARLEPLAAPGGILVTEALRSQLWNKVDAGFEPIGGHRLKNIADAVEIYRVTARGRSPTTASPSPWGEAGSRRSRSRRSGRNRSARRGRRRGAGRA